MNHIINLNIYSLSHQLLNLQLLHSSLALGYFEEDILGIMWFVFPPSQILILLIPPNYQLLKIISSITSSLLRNYLSCNFEFSL